MNIQQEIEQAIAHHQAGRLGEAEAIYRRVLAYEPNHPNATHLLGLLAYNIGKYEAAEQLMRRSLALDSRPPQFYGNLGLVLAALGRLDEAIATYQQALALQPQYPEAYNNLGIVLYEQRKYDEAGECYRQAITLRPEYVDAINNLGNALSDRKQTSEAIACYQRVIALQPNHPDAYNNLGDIFVEQEKLEEGLACFKHACTLKKDFVEAYSNIANVMYRLCRLDEGIAYNREAIRLKPDFATAHWNLGLSLLCQGKLADGWKEYNWRTKVRDLAGNCREFPQPMWDGGDLHGKTILLHAEQGVGDTFQFIRFLPQVKARGGKILFDCGEQLMRLLKANFQVDQWIATGEPLPPFDVHCPMLSLPVSLGTTLETIPQNMPYIQADAELSRQWKARLNEQVKGQAGKKIGLVWAGRPQHANDHNRSIALSALLPILQLQGITQDSGRRPVFFSLQKSQAAEQIQSLPVQFRPIDLTGDLHDFADTAAMIANLDLVIAVDTSVVHLAGAMNKPVWMLVPFSPDWRWMLNRADSPWYPSLRIFRQQRPGDWNHPIAAIVDALHVVVNNR
jgi:tetratricopeptide (TPR) repeat protein